MVAPARSLAWPWVEGAIPLAEARLRSLGLTVTYGEHVRERDAFGSSSVEHRLADLHAAFADPAVTLVLPVAGGFNSNQLLRHLEYDLFRAHPKVVGGFSDITALANALYARTGVVTYSSPCLFNFGEPENVEYTVEQFRRCVTEDGPYVVPSSERWSYDKWARGVAPRTFHPNRGPWTVQPGCAEGTIVGGNLSTFNLLHGTEYLPDLTDTILFAEDDHESRAVNFDRDLQSVLHLPGARGIRGVVLGRFEAESEVTPELLRGIVESKEELRGVPVVADADFGHTTPLFTFPIGGRARLEAGPDGVRLEILVH